MVVSRSQDAGHFIECCVVDFKDAFYTLHTLQEEWPFVVVRGLPKTVEGKEKLQLVQNFLSRVKNRRSSGTVSVNLLVSQFSGANLLC